MDENKKGNKKFLLKKEIASRYNISVRTLSNILDEHKAEIGLPVGYLYTPVQVDKIKEIIGDFEPFEAS